MLEHALERWISRDAAGQADGAWIESAGQFDRGALGFVADRLVDQGLVQRLATAGMNGASGRADLRVGKSRQLLLAEIDQPAFPLQHREQEQRLLAARELLRGDRERRRRQRR